MPALAPDDLNLSDYVTILRGHSERCPLGCCQNEVGERFKGVPLVVVAIDLPYILAAVPIGLGTVVLDSRLVELKRVSPAYMQTFKAMNSVVASPEGPSTVHRRRDSGNEETECSGR
jgi:hypothetical protein